MSSSHSPDWNKFLGFHRFIIRDTSETPKQWLAVTPELNLRAEGSDRFSADDELVDLILDRMEKAIQSGSWEGFFTPAPKKVFELCTKGKDIGGDIGLQIPGHLSEDEFHRAAIHYGNRMSTPEYEDLEYHWKYLMPVEKVPGLSA